MIPFNHLGILFNTFGNSIYPKSVRKVQCRLLGELAQKSNVLDIGAGTGILCKFGHECREDLHFSAIDPAEGMMKYAKEYIDKHIATAEALPFKDDSFDLAMMGESLHHFRDVDKALSETVRVLKNDAKLFIYDFDVSTFMGKAIYKGEKFLGEPVNFFEPEDLKVKLESYGFTVEIQMHSWRYTIIAKLKK